MNHGPADHRNNRMTVRPAIIPPAPWILRPPEPSYYCEPDDDSPSPGGEGRGEGERVPAISDHRPSAWVQAFNARISDSVKSPLGVRTNASFFHQDRIALRHISINVNPGNRHQQ